MAGQRGGQVVQGQVGADHRIAAAGACQGRADYAAGEEHIGGRGDRLIPFQRPVEPGAAARIVALLQFLAADYLIELAVEEEGQGTGARQVVPLDAPDLIDRIRRGIQGLSQRLVAQVADHEEVAIVIADVECRQLGIVLQGLGQGAEQDVQAVEAVQALVGAAQGQQVEQVIGGLVGLPQVGFHFLADAVEEFITAGKDDLAGLTIIEQAQDHTGEQ
ncbi:hypothetical protein D9M72_389210 [compost metagenome]